MTLFLFIFQCFCFMKNPGRFEINLNTEKKIQTFCFNTVTQFSFLCWHASNNILLANHFDNIAFPVQHQMLNCYISRPFIMSLPLHFSASPPLVCIIACACEEISVGACWGPLWMATTPSFPPLCPCLQGWCWLLGWWCVVTAANMVPQFLCTRPSASICSPPSSRVQDVLVCLALWWGMTGELEWLGISWWGHRELELSVGASLGPGVQHCSSPGCRSRCSSPAVLPICVWRSCPMVMVPSWTLGNSHTALRT